MENIKLQLVRLFRETYKWTINLGRYSGEYNCERLPIVVEDEFISTHSEEEVRLYASWVCNGAGYKVAGEDMEMAIISKYNQRGKKKKSAGKKPNRAYDFCYSPRKKCFIVKNTTICVEQLGTDQWQAYRATGVYPYITFYGVEADASNPIAAVNKLLKKRKNKSNENMH